MFAIILSTVQQAASYPHIEEMLEGIILTSPALRVKPAHPIVGVSELFGFKELHTRYKCKNV